MLDQLKDLLQPSTSSQCFNTPTRNCLPSVRKRRLAELSDDDDDDDDDDVDIAKSDGATNDASSNQPTTKKQKSHTINTQKTYNSQSVILEGVHDNLKTNPKKFHEALKAVKPDVEITGARRTASGAMLIFPKTPKDCNMLLKEKAFCPNSHFGPIVSARLPKEQTITHQVIIKNLDTEVTEDEVKEMLERQGLEYISVKRTIFAISLGTNVLGFNSVIKTRNSKIQ